MSYVVLARKYRPVTFAGLVGQEPVVRTLRNAMRMGRVHHAFLLTGARGVGKTTTARLLARGLNCAQGPTIEPCGTCAHCESMGHNNAPDVIEIDGASHTGVDNVRELREATRYMPSTGRFKLYIIDEVHMLSQAAFNALLKTLEEPPPHIKFIFATTEPHKIPITILSRCQRFDLRRIELPVLTEHLAEICRAENIEASPETLAVIAREGQGSVRDALSLLDQVRNFAGDRPLDEVVAQALGLIDRQIIFALVDGVAQRDAARLLAQARQCTAAGQDLSQVMTLMVHHLRDVAVARALAEPGPALPERTPSEIAQLVAQAQQRSLTDWHRLFEKGCDIAQDLPQSEMPEVTFEMGLLRLMQMAPTADLEDLLERLDTLVTSTPTEPGAQAPARPRSAVAAAPAHRVEPPPPASQGPAAPASAPAAKAQPVAPAAVNTEVASRAGDDVGGMGWRLFVDRVRQERPDLASVLEQGVLLTFAPTGVEVGYTPGTFFWDAASDAEHRALFGKLLAVHMKQTDVPFKVVARQAAEHAQAPKTLADERRAEAQDAWSQTEAQARQHDHVQAAMRVLGGEVLGIEPIKDKS